jgi:hypothetical protein
MENWPGHLHFTVEFSKAQDKTKATPWIVSYTHFCYIKFTHVQFYIYIVFHSIPQN